MIRWKSRECGRAAPWYSQRKLAIEWNFQLGRELNRIERAAREETVANLQRRDFAPAMIYAQDEIFSIGIFFDIDFAKWNAAVFQEGLYAAAVGTPAGRVHHDRFHGIRGHRLITN